MGVSSRAGRLRLYVEAMSDDKESEPGTGMRAMFWTWMTIIAGGLLVMIVLPLSGR